MLKINKILRGKPFPNGDVPVKIIVKFSHDVRVTVGTNLAVNPKHWDKEKERIKHTYNNGVQYNMILDDLTTEIQAWALKCQTEKKDLTPETFAAWRDGNDNTDLIQFFEQDLQDRVRSLPTYTSYKNTFAFLSAYRKSVLPSELSAEWLEMFDNFLAKQGHNPNTRKKHMKNLAFIVKRYVNEVNKQRSDRGRVVANPFADYKVGRIKGSKVPLTQEEVRAISSYDYEIDSYRMVADAFVMLCYTGMRISDYLTQCNKDHMDGATLCYRPRKTDGSSGVRVELPLDKLFAGEPLRLMEKYDFNPPKPAEQYMNRVLKVIAFRLGIKKKLSIHVARHTFITYIAVKTGNVFLVMQLSGLVKIETAQEYIHIAEGFREVDGLSKVEW